MTLNMKDVLDCARNFRDRHVLVIGDFMLDEYLYGYIERISPEAPVPINALLGLFEGNAHGSRLECGIRRSAQTWN